MKPLLISHLYRLKQKVSRHQCQDFVNYVVTSGIRLRYGSNLNNLEETVQ